MKLKADVLVGIFLAGLALSTVRAQVPSPTITSPGDAEVLTPKPDVEVPLPAPPATPNVAPEVYAKGHFRDVSKPALNVYFNPDFSKPHPAIIICPGGGYGALAYDSQVNRWIPFFHSQGFTVFGLKYRLNAKGIKARREAAALDIRAALGVIHTRAQEWKIDAKQVGILGVSAGSNAILNFLSDQSKSSPSHTFVEGAQPAFAVLLSPWPGGQQPEDFAFSSSQTPPLFIGSARDDKTAPVTFAESIAARAKAQGVSVLLDVIETGGHGAFHYGATQPGGDWTLLFVPWVQKLTPIPPQPPLHTPTPPQPSQR